MWRMVALEWGRRHQSDFGRHSSVAAIFSTLSYSRRDAFALAAWAFVMVCDEAHQWRPVIFQYLVIWFLAAVRRASVGASASLAIAPFRAWVA